MNAREAAVHTALQGLTWERPCLIWLADYLVAETGRDYAADWRGIRWTERTAIRALKGLAVQGRGERLVERVIDAMARLHGWPEADSNRQGAVMIGVYRGLARDGVPAIYDGEARWIAGHIGSGLASLGEFPDRAWEVVR